MKRINLFMGGIFTAVGVVFVVVGLLTALLLRVPLLLLFALFGLPFLLLGIGFLRRDAKEKQDDAWLQENGSRIYADFVAVQFNTSVRVNGRCPLIIQCQAVNPADDLDQQDLPDLVAQRITALDQRVSQLEKAAQGDTPPTREQVTARSNSLMWPDSRTEPPES